MDAASGMPRRRFLTGAAALAMPFVGGVALPARGGEAYGVDAATAARIEQRVGQFLADFSAPGLSLAYGRDGAIAFTGAYGLADPAASEAMTSRHRLRIASVAKPMTAAAVMMLVERGRIGLEQKIFGEYGLLNHVVRIDASHPHPDWLQSITVDHLLTHTAGGWTNDGNDPMWRHSWVDHDRLIAATLVEAPLANPPGTTHGYSNFGYCLLGRIVAAMSGQSYEAFVRTQLLAPAGIRDMEIGGNTRADRRPGEVVYVGQGGHDPYGFNLARMDSHGGWIANAADLVRFAQAVDGVAPDIIGPQSIATMGSPSAASPWYGRGWSINPGHGNRWHVGGLPGTTSMLAQVAGGTAFAGLVNTRTIDGRDAVNGLEALLWDVNGLVLG